MAAQASNRLQDDLLMKEQQRIERKREIYEQRKKRIHNAKTRMFGVDVDALNAQMAEKQSNKDRDAELAQYEKMQALEIERMLAAAAEEERQMREYQMKQMKDSWESELAKKRTEKSRPRSPDFDPMNSGPSSLQVIEGEDPQRMERIRMQQQQMRDWIQEQIAEKQYMKQLDLEDEMNYAELIRTIDEIREATDLEEKEMRRYITDTVKLENLELAKGQQSRRRVQNTISNADNSAIPTSLQVFDEDQNVAMDANGRIVRKDMFRGYTHAQKQRFFEENQQIMRDNQARRRAEQDEDSQWVMQQQMTMRAMEQADLEEARIKRMLKDEQLAFLREQIELQKRTKREWTQQMSNAITNEFYEKFGKDHR